MFTRNIPKRIFERLGTLSVRWNELLDTSASTRGTLETNRRTETGCSSTFEKRTFYTMSMVEGRGVNRGKRVVRGDKHPRLGSANVPNPRRSRAFRGEDTVTRTEKETHGYVYDHVCTVSLLDRRSICISGCFCFM